MKKNYLLTILFFMPFVTHNIQQKNQIQKSTHAKNNLKIKVKNKTSIPVLGNIFVSGAATGIRAGYYGILLPAQKNKEQTIPEFFWFEKQAIGGFRKPGEPSKVHSVDVLKHGFANSIEIIIPNDKKYEFTLQQKKYTIIIKQDKNSQTNVTLREQKGHKSKGLKVPTKQKTLLNEIEKEIEKNIF